jgi:hypothetical protein
VAIEKVLGNANVAIAIELHGSTPQRAVANPHDSPTNAALAVALHAERPSVRLTQHAQRSISIANTRFSRCAHVSA